jgi:urease accessory protein
LTDPTMSVSVPLGSETFAGNRAVGSIALTVAASTAGSRRQRVHESGSLRVRFPNAPGRTLDAVLVNTAGGMTGGDRFDIDLDVGKGAALTVTTAAAEKIYRSLGPDTAIAVKLKVGDGGVLAWLPQETILFDQVRLRRSIDVELDSSAELLLVEAIVFGRSAMGETVAQGHLTDRWRIRRDSRLVLAETVRLDGKIAEQLARPASTAGGVAIATIIKIPSGDQDVAAVRAMADNFAGEVGVSAWSGLMAVRFVARDGAALRRDLITVLGVLGTTPLPRLWLN